MEIAVWIFFVLGAGLGNIVPLTVEAIYFLFGWPSWTTAFMLEYYNLAISSVYLAFSALLAVGMAFLGSPTWYLMNLIQIGSNLYLMYVMTVRTPGALQYVDPEWDNAAPDGRLYPFFWDVEEFDED